MQINSKYIFIDNKKSFELALVSIKNSKFLAVDTESSGYYTYYSRVCLIQCSARGKNYIFDPLSQIQIEKLADLFADPSITKIFHSAVDDIKVLKRDFGFQFQNLVDTMYSSKLLGLEHNSLNYLIEHYHGMKLSKAMQKSNWEIRPLHNNQLKYAALDTVYLEATWEKMQKELADRDLLQEAYSEFAKMQDEPPAEKEGNGEIPWYKFHNLAKYNPEQRRAIYDILHFREEKAKRINKSPFRILNHDAIQKIILEKPDREYLLKKFGKSDGETVFKLLENPSGPPIDKIEYPRPDAHLEGEEEKTYKRLKKLREDIIRVRNIDHSMLPSNKHLVAIINHQPQDLVALKAMNLMSDWKVENYGNLILHALNKQPYQELLKQLTPIENQKKNKRPGFNAHFIEKKTSKDFSSPQLPEEQKGLKISSVLIPILIEDNHPTFILTKRSEDLSNHPGQISFPGGIMDTEDRNLLDTAIREWEEETGESRDSIKIIGKLDSVITTTGFHITPIVSSYRPLKGFQPSPKEVDAMIQLRFDDLKGYPFYRIPVNQEDRPEKEMFYFMLPEGLLWGATCEILVKFLRKFAGFTHKPITAEFNMDSPPFFQPPDDATKEKPK